MFILLNNNLNNYKGVILYNSTTYDTNQNTYTLSDSVNNYTYIKILFVDNDNFMNSTEVIPEVNPYNLTTTVPLISVRADSSNTTLYIKTTCFTIAETTIYQAKNSNEQYSYACQISIPNSKVIGTWTAGKYIAIAKVIGYKDF